MDTIRKILVVILFAFMVAYTFLAALPVVIGAWLITQLDPKDENGKGFDFGKSFEEALAKAKVKFKVKTQ